MSVSSLRTERGCEVRVAPAHQATRPHRDDPKVCRRAGRWRSARLGYFLTTAGYELARVLNPGPGEGRPGAAHRHHARSAARGRNIVAVQLLERSDGLAALEEHRARAALGRGGLVFLGGEAGVGKTSLVRWFLERQRSRSRILVGACEPLATPRPLGPLFDMASGLGPKVRGALDAEAYGPSLFAAFLDDLAAGPPPVIVLVEDVHWADQATCDLLRFVGRRLGGVSTLVLATYRDDELGPLHPLRVVLGDLGTSSSTHRMTVAPLSAEAVALLARGTGLDAGNLYRQTAGNPFFVTEVLAARTQGVPATVRDAVHARVARLAPPARELLDVAAVIGATIEPWLLGAEAGVADQTLAQCLESGVLRRDGDLLAFRHELARAAIEEAITPVRAAALNRRVLDALGARQGTDPGRLAHHAEAAGERGAMLAHATAAAERSARLGAHREAAAQYARALRAGELVPSEARARLLEARAFECFVSNQMAEALEARRAALAIWRERGDRLREGDNLRWLARAYWVSGRMEKAEEAARAAVDLLETLTPGRELAMAYSHRGHLDMLRFRNAEALRWGERALRLADRDDDEEIRVHAIVNMGIARIQSGDDGGFDAVREAIERAKRAGLDDHAARAYFHCVQVTTWQRRHDLAERWFDEGYAYCVTREHETFQQFLLAWHARSLLDQGRWDEAEAMAEDVLRRSPFRDVRRLQALTVLGLVHARRGDTVAARYLDEAAEFRSLSPELTWELGVAAARAERASYLGDHAGMRAEAEAAFTGAVQRGEAWCLGELAYWLWRADALERAPDGAAEPYALEITGRWREAAALWNELGCPFEAARALAHRDEASGREALAVFERLGARPAASAAARHLRRLGARGLPRGPWPATRRNPAGLTDREIDVLRLVASGLRNAEVAERLVISQRTVDHHVSAILGKLGVASRAEAVKVAREFGALGER